MEHEQGPGKQLSGLVVSRSGSVKANDDPALPWVVLDGSGAVLEPVSEYLRELLACGNSPASCRSYGHDLLRWFRFLAAVDVPWNRAQRSNVRDFVLWLRTSHNPARDRRRPAHPRRGRSTGERANLIWAQGMRRRRSTTHWR